MTIVFVISNILSKWFDDVQCKKNKDKFTKLHCLSRNAEQRRKWLDACGLQEVGKSKIFICSNHFHTNDYKGNGNCRYLRDGISPTLLLPPHIQLGISSQCSSTYMPSHDMQSMPSQCLPTELTPHADFACGSDQNIAIPKEPLLPEDFGRKTGKRLFNEPRYINEVCVDHVATPRRAKRVIDMMKNASKKFY